MLDDYRAREHLADLSKLIHGAASASGEEVARIVII
jgi:hypothetical protein